MLPASVNSDGECVRYWMAKIEVFEGTEGSKEVEECKGSKERDGSKRYPKSEGSQETKEFKGYASLRTLLASVSSDASSVRNGIAKIEIFEGTEGCKEVEGGKEVKQSKMSKVAKMLDWSRSVEISEDQRSRI